MTSSTDSNSMGNNVGVRGTTNALSFIALVAIAFVALVSTGIARAQDCNNNGIPDNCDISCGSSGGPCDIPGCGTKQDCNNNGVPDDCELTSANGSLDFDGSDDIVTVPRHVSLEPATELTIEAWIKPDTIGASNNRIVRMSGDFAPGYILAASQSGGYALQLRIDGATQGSVSAADTDAFSSYVGKWTHVAGVYSSSGHYCRLYVNGVMKDEKQSVGTIQYSGANLTIGNAPFGAERFDGRIDEVRIWNIARTQAQLLAEKDHRLAGNESGLVGYWRFDEGSGQDVIDSSLNNNDGVLGTTAAAESSDPAWLASGSPIFSDDCNANSIPDDCDIANSTSSDANSNGRPDECELPTILYVDLDASGTSDGSSWTDAFTDLQSALTAAVANGGMVEIRVAEGTYKPTAGADRNATFQLRANVTIKGGYAGGGNPDPDERNISTHLTTLSGDLSGDDGPNFANYGENSQRVVLASSVDSSAVLDGFTIMGGSGDLSPELDGTFGGGGMVCVAGSPRIINCTFRKNRGQNVAGGVYASTTSNPTFDRCRFVTNSALGQTGQGAGGAIYVRNNSRVRMTHCTFFGNTAIGSIALGGAAYVGLDSNAIMSGCVFSGNSSQFRGGAVYASGTGKGQLTNCTISGNTATGTNGAGVHAAGARLSLTNCILWGNSNANGTTEGAQAGISGAGIIYANYCCVQGLTGALGGIKNIGANPLLTDSNGADDVVGTEDDDLHLQAGSPCVNVGNNTAAELASTDIDGNPRIQQCGADIGADETAQLGPDCNNNGVADACDISLGTSSDCNGNLIPDSCDAGPDCNSNGILDSCEIGNVLFSDRCEDAKPIMPGKTYSGSTAGASTDGYMSCVPLTLMTSDVWYKYTPAFDGDASLAATTSDFGVVLSVHSACPGMIANQLTCGTGNETGLLSIQFHVNAGGTYWIRVSGWPAYNLSAVGNFSIILTGPPVAGSDCNNNSIPDGCDITSALSTDCNANGVPDSCDIAAPAYSADDCTDAKLVTTGVTYFFTSIGDTTHDGIASCSNQSILSRDLWFKYVPTATGTLQVTIDRTDGGTAPYASIHSGCPGTVLNQLSCNGGSSSPSITMTAITHKPYYIRVSGHSDTVGRYRLLLGGPPGYSSNCNANQLPDICELTDNDCNVNGVPDECEYAIVDCNNNGVTDGCDLEFATSQDCNRNLVPDECDLVTCAQGIKWCADCNNNGILDTCDLRRGNGVIAPLTSLAVSGGPGRLIAGPLDSGTSIDLAIANSDSDTVAILYNAEGGRFAPPIEHAVGDKPRDIVKGDFDGDGDIDLAVANQNSGTVSVLINNGISGFAAGSTLVCGPIPTGLAIGDLNHDTKLDLATCNNGNDTVSVFIGNGDGTFASAASYSLTSTFLPASIQIGDVNNDTHNDLVLACESPQKIVVLQNDWSGQFPTQINRSLSIAPSWVTLGDLDGDNDLDLVLTTSAFSPARVYVMLNLGGGVFDDPVAYVVSSGSDFVLLADVDGDNDLDIVSTNWSNPAFSVLKNSGSGAFAAATNYDVGMNARGVASGDFDGDGNFDLALAGSSSQAIPIRYNSGNGTFSPAIDTTPVQTSPKSVAVGDWDNDGDIDAAVANNGSDNVTILMNNRDGTVTTTGNYGIGAKPHSLLAADLDKDGDLDLVAPNAPFAGGNTVSILMNNGTGAFAAPVSYVVDLGIVHVTMGDVDNDGDLDMACCQWGTKLYLLLNNGAGVFGSPVLFTSTGFPESSVLVDLNNDQKLDWAVAHNSSNQVSVRIGNGNGTFQSPVYYPVAGSPRSISATDFDVDGDLDLAIISGTLCVLRNNGNGTFALAENFVVTGGGGSSMTMGDLDGDGRHDFVVSNSGSNMVAIVLNTPNLSFSTAGAFITSVGPAGSGVLDLNCDARPDLVIACSTTNLVTLWHNDSTVPPVQDYNGNGIPDECDDPADMNGDGLINDLDVPLFVQQTLNTQSSCGAASGDINHDGIINGADVTGFVNTLSGG